MWPNPQFPVNLVTFTEEILNEKLNSLCSVVLREQCFRETLINVGSWNVGKISGKHGHVWWRNNKINLLSRVFCQDFYLICPIVLAILFYVHIYISEDNSRHGRSIMGYSNKSVITQVTNTYQKWTCYVNKLNLFT